MLIHLSNKEKQVGCQGNQIKVGSVPWSFVGKCTWEHLYGQTGSGVKLMPQLVTPFPKGQGQQASAPSHQPDV